jgi:hypothetical protein
MEFEAELKYGLTDRLQISAGVPLTSVNPNEGSGHFGVSDVSLALNYNFIQNDRFAVAFRSAFTLPTGDENQGLGGGQFAWTPYLLGAVRVGAGDIYAGIGEELGDDTDQFTYTIAGAYPFGKFVGVLELTGFTGGGEDTLYLAPGAYWVPTDHFQVGIGVPIGLTNDSDDYRVIGRIAIEF